MTLPLVEIPAEVMALCATHTIITPNERLAREFIHSYDRYQMQSGAQGWPTVSVASLQRFLLTEMDRFLEVEPGATRLISRNELLISFFTHAPEGFSRLATRARDAYELVRRYEVDLSDTELVSTRGNLFKNWIEQVESAHDGVPQPGIPALLIEHDFFAERPVVLYHVDHLARTEQRYFDMLCERHPSSVVTGTSDADSKAPRGLRATACVSAGDEIAAAAHWAKSVKEKDADATIGIVVPDLANSYETVLRQVAAILDPNVGASTPSFDISSGIDLARQPLWRHARTLLRWTQTPLAPEELLALAHSPFFGLTFLQALTRWPPALRKFVRAADIKQRFIAAEQDALLEQLDSMPATATLAEWVDTFLALLTTASWPATQRLGSAQYQAFITLNDTLGELRRFATEPLSSSAALELIDTVLATRTFAPERPHTDVHVLGMLESTGLAFSHLWVCGMDEESFPQQASVNPFIPRRLAARYGIPRSTDRDELAFARRTLNEWQQSSGQLRVSFTETVEESLRRPTPLLDAPKVKRFEPDAKAIHPYFKPTKVGIETIVDLNGSSLPAGPVGGGIGILREQARCPFRAFAIYRLGLREPRAAADFPDALSRGIVLHEVLSTLFEDITDQVTIASLSEADIRSAIATTLRRIEPNTPTAFNDRELERLSTTVHAWLAVEQEREPFDSVEVEKAFELELGELVFNVRIDRIDRTSNGTMVIDYKTGQVQLANARRSPPTEPQLPAYSLVVENIYGAYYAQIREGDIRLLGIAPSKDALPRSRTTVPEVAWEAQVQNWHADLEIVARHIAGGDARVTPVAGACSNCHLRSFCRVGESDAA